MILCDMIVLILYRKYILTKTENENNSFHSRRIISFILTVSI